MKKIILIIFVFALFSQFVYSQNNIPLLSGPYYKETCVGFNVSFSIQTNDYDAKDTLQISWDAAIPGATWSDNNGKVKHPTGVMTWKPDEVHASDTPWVFTVTLTDGKDSATQAYEILVNPIPKAEFDIEKIECHKYKFTAQSTNTSDAKFIWIGNFMQGFVNTDSSFIYTFKNPGIFPFTISVEENRCMRTYYDTIEVSFYRQHQTGFTISNQDVNKPLQINFTDTSTIDTGAVLSWLWDFGDGQTSTVQSPIHTYSSYGIYNVTLTTTSDLGCSRSKNIVIEIREQGLGTNPVETASLKIYPNPIKNKLFISSANNLINIRIYNSVGSLMIDQKVDHQKNVEIDLSHLPKGIYLLTLHSSDVKINSHLILKE